MTPHRLALAATLTLALMHATPDARAQVLVDHIKVINGTVMPGIPVGYPLVLNAPGHYKLTSDLWVPLDKAGITVSADNVTIDLNGFTVHGKVQCARYANQPNAVTCYDNNWNPVVAGQKNGISTNRRGTVVRNGRLHGFPGHGIWALGAITIEDVSVSSNARSGVVVGHEGSRSSRLSDVTAETNAEDGMQAQHALIVRAIVTGNGRHGIQARRTAIQHSLARHQLGRGLDALDMITVLGTTLLDNAGGPMAGPVTSLGANFDGAAPF